MGELSLAMLVIIGVNVLVSFKGFSDQPFFNKYKFNIADIKRGSKFQIFTSGFLHVDTGHLFVNMLTLYFFANVLIYNLGAIGFIVIYIGSLLLGNLLSYFFHKDDYNYTAVGASGAVMGVLYSAILLQPDMMMRVDHAAVSRSRTWAAIAPSPLPSPRLSSQGSTACSASVRGS